jgi:hypothetical protein
MSIIFFKCNSKISLPFYGWSFSWFWSRRIPSFGKWIHIVRHIFWTLEEFSATIFMFNDYSVLHLTHFVSRLPFVSSFSFRAYLLCLPFFLRISFSVREWHNMDIKTGEMTNSMEHWSSLNPLFYNWKRNFPRFMEEAKKAFVTFVLLWYCGIVYNVESLITSLWHLDNGIAGPKHARG